MKQGVKDVMRGYNSAIELHKVERSLKGVDLSIASADRAPNTFLGIVRGSGVYDIFSTLNKAKSRCPWLPLPR